MKSEANTQVEMEGTTAALNKSHRIVQAATAYRSNPPMAGKSSPHMEDRNNHPTAVVVKTKMRLKATVVVNSQITPKATAHDNKENTHPAVAMEVTGAVKNATNTLLPVVAMADKNIPLEVTVADKKRLMVDSKSNLMVVTRAMANDKRSRMESSRAIGVMRTKSMALVAAGTVATTSNMESVGKMRMSTVGTEHFRSSLSTHLLLVSTRGTARATSCESSLETTTKKERVVRDDYVVENLKTEGSHRLHKELHKLDVSFRVFSAQHDFHEHTTQHPQSGQACKGSLCASHCLCKIPRQTSECRVMFAPILSMTSTLHPCREWPCTYSF